MVGQLPPEVRDALRQVSKSLLGNRLRLEVGAAIAESQDGLLYGREVARLLDVADNQALSELRHFTAAGLVDELPMLADQKRRYFRRRYSEDSSLWPRWLGLFEEIADLARINMEGRPDLADQPGTNLGRASPAPDEN